MALTRKARLDLLVNAEPVDLRVARNFDSLWLGHDQAHAHGTSLLPLVTPARTGTRTPRRTAPCQAT